MKPPLTFLAAPRPPCCLLRFRVSSSHLPPIAAFAAGPASGLGTELRVHLEADHGAPAPPRLRLPQDAGAVDTDAAPAYTGVAREGRPGDKVRRRRRFTFWFGCGILSGASEGVGGALRQEWSCPVGKVVVTSCHVLLYPLPTIPPPSCLSTPPPLLCAPPTTWCRLCSLRTDCSIFTIVSGVLF